MVSRYSLRLSCLLSARRPPVRPVEVAVKEQRMLTGRP